MELTIFEMERMQSTWENVVEYNLAESGVHPLTLRELLAMDGGSEEILGFPMAYSQSNGTPELRRIVAGLYPGAGEQNILVTTGSSEANFLILWHLLNPGDEFVVMLPNYMQVLGLGQTFGARVRPFHLKEVDKAWRVDEEELKGAITRRTKLVAICNPNNPTGATLGMDFLKLVADLASEAGAWVLSDEVYQGAERVGDVTPSLWGLYDRALVVNGLSKAYGLPGLRIGWVAGPAETVDKLWAYHDYTTIGPAYATDRLAQIALRPANRGKILGRTKGILRHNYPIIEKWIRDHGELFRFAESRAGAIQYLAYNLDLNSTALAERLIHNRSVLVVPGDHFGMDGFLRLGYGPEPDYLRAGLSRVEGELKELTPKGAR